MTTLQLLAEPFVVGLGHAKQVSNDVQREWGGEVPYEFALPSGHELVDLPVRMPPHERLVLTEPLRRHESHQHATMGLVLGGGAGGDLIAEGQLIWVLRHEA